MSYLLGLVVLFIVIGFPLLWVLFATGQYPNWRRRAKEFDREQREKRRDGSTGQP